MSDEITQTSIEENTTVVPTETIPPEVVTPFGTVTPSEIVSIPEIPIEPTVTAPEIKQTESMPLITVNPVSEPEINPPSEIISEPIPAQVTQNPITPPPIEATQIENPPTITEPIKEENIIRGFLLKLLDKANLATKTRNAKRLEKLTIFFDTNPRVTNNMVEKLLKVSDSTATNYLKKLKNQGKIIQHGKTGGIFYTKA